MIPQGKITAYIGIARTAIENNNDRILEVYVPELLPFKTGIMKKNDKPEQKVITLMSPDNVPVIGKVQLTDTIQCEYMGLSTNNDVPDIHVGEQVVVLNVAGTEKFYWVPLGRDDNLRRVEHYRISIADEQKTVKELNDDNTYFFEMDTRKYKRVIISTSKSDGEKFRYKIEIDAKANTVIIQDDDGNFFKLDSNIPMLIMQDKPGCKVQICDKNINIFAVDTINMEAGKDIHIKAGDKMTVEAKKSITTKTEKNQENYKDNVILAEKMIESAKQMSINAEKGNVGQGIPFKGKPCGCC